MTSPLFDVVSTPAAADAFERLSESDQMALGHLVTLLRLDPWPDGVTKVGYEPEGAPPTAASVRGRLVAYHDRRWTLLYRIAGQTITIEMILRHPAGRGPSQP